MRKHLTSPQTVLTIPEVARILQICPKTARSYIASGQLRAFRLKRQFRVFPEDVEKFIQEGQAR